MKQIELVIFDCDGVLVDSEIVASRVSAKHLSDAGYPITAEDMNERFAGLTFKETLLAIEAETSQPLSAAILEKVEAETDKRLAREVRDIEGAADVLRGIGHPFCICSNSAMKRLETTLGRTGLMPLVEGKLYSAQDLEGVRPKPAPDVYLHAAAEHGADPARTFVIEDSTHGVHGARQAGMRVVGFTGGSHSYTGHAEKLQDAGAETVINKLSDFRETIEAMNAFGVIT